MAKHLFSHMNRDIEYTLSQAPVQIDDVFTCRHERCPTSIPELRRSTPPHLT